MRRWGHHHSILVGGLAVAGLSSSHLLWLLTVVFALGLVVGLAASSIRHAARITAGRLADLHAEKLATARERRLEIHARKTAANAKARSLKRERERLEREAYWRGVGDGSR